MCYVQLAANQEEANNSFFDEVGVDSPMLSFVADNKPSRTEDNCARFR